MEQYHLKLILQIRILDSVQGCLIHNISYNRLAYEIIELININILGVYSVVIRHNGFNFS